MPLSYVQRKPDSETHKPEPLSLAALFGNENPLEIEIGCGKGKFLLGMAQEFPERNFLGIDYVGKWMRVGETRGQKRQIQNLRFVKAEMREFLQTLPRECAEAFHIYFPDPWPKRRHRRRRLVDAAFLTELAGYVKPRGHIYAATDDADYYAQMRNAAAASVMLWASVRESVNQRLAHPHLKTNYELKYEAAGKPLYYMEIVKGTV